MSYALAAFAVAAVVYGLLAAHIYWRERVPRVVTWPATGESVGVGLSALRTALALHRRPVLAITHCTLWPARRECAQACLAEIERSPEGCAFQRLLQQWYRGKACAFCGRAVAELGWGELQPSLLSADGRI